MTKILSKKSVLWALCTLLTALLLGCVSAGAVSQDDITTAGDAYYDAEQDHYVLTEERTWQGGALWFSQVRCNDNFNISLDFYTGHADHVDSYGGADGICVAFYASGGQSGEEGQGLGFDGCGGYGVEIDTYRNTSESDPEYNHIAIVKETVGNHLQLADATGFTEDGKWHHLQISNRRGVCTVFVDGEQVLQAQDIVPNGRYEIGITAATGSGCNYHAVKNIVLEEAVWTEASPWADDELMRAQELDLIPQVLYDRDLSQPITRAEFAAVAVKTYEALAGTAAVPAANNPFEDCSDTEVLKAYNIGAVYGTSTTTYEPDLLLNREQAATMLTRVFKKINLAGWTLPTDAQFTLSYTKPAPFDDDAVISDWARDSVYFMAANNIIQGSDGLFMPRAVTSAQEAMGYALTTREQALLIAVRMVENLGA